MPPFVRLPRLVFDKRLRPQQHQMRVQRRQRLQLESGAQAAENGVEETRTALHRGLAGAATLAGVTAGLQSDSGAARCDGMSLVLAARKRKGRHRLRAHRGAVGDNAAPIGKEGGQASRSGRVKKRHSSAVDTSVRVKPLGRDQPMKVRYRNMKEKMHRIQVQRSPIHEWGAFLTESVGPNELLLEYVGELIRYSLCDKREKEYERKGIGTYVVSLRIEFVLNVCLFFSGICFELMMIMLLMLQ